MVAVVGRTNSGKSTLVNRLVGEKVSIVSGMEQTTRNRIRAIVTEARGQLVFLDTPGAHKAENELGTLMNRMARGAGRNADVLLVVFDGAAPVRLEDEGWMARAAFAGCPVVFALNKADAPGFSGEIHALDKKLFLRAPDVHDSRVAKRLSSGEP